MKANRDLVELIRLLRRHGIRDNKLFKNILDQRTITDSIIAVKIIDIIRNQPEAKVIYEDEEGGIDEEPVYATVIEYRSLILSYFSSTTKCFLKIREKSDLDRELSFLKKLMKKQGVVAS